MSHSVKSASKVSAMTGFGIGAAGAQPATGVGIVAGLRRRLDRAMAHVAGWRERARSRRELRLLLGERDLADLSLSRVDALREARKPFWTH